LKVFHITYWYPTKDQPQSGIFIKNHINGLQAHCENNVHHIQVIESNDFFKKITTDQSTIYKTKFAKYYFIQERLALVALKKVLKNKNLQTADLINLHIATPLGRYLDLIQNKTKKKIVITEHWTAYYRFFGLSQDHSGLQRIKEIFAKKFKLITVSRALGEDIKKFSGINDLDYEVIPNIISTNTFNYRQTNSGKTIFFMMTNWSPEKNPLRILSVLHEIDFDFELRIAGDGVQLAAMKNFVADYRLDKKVTFIGRIEPEQAASEFRRASAFIHSAFYETFSVVCAEALCCGCPVISSNIPAIVEYLDAESGILINDFESKDEEQSKKNWKAGIEKFRTQEFHRKDISEKFITQFGHEKVSLDYYQLLKRYVEA
jgi:L-malate glycosyltransferase